LPPITLVKEKQTWKDYLFDGGPWAFGALLVIVGIFQVCLMLRQTAVMAQQNKLSADSLGVINRQADLQQSARQQWLEIFDWDSRMSEDRAFLHIQFAIQNPTDFPLTIKRAEIIFNMPGFPLVFPIIDPALKGCYAAA
jgi:hypothetical protein